MWELNYKEGWVPKTWFFWTVVLEKTLESPLDCKEIQPVHPKGNRSWVFIGGIDAEAETPILLATWCEELTHWKRLWCWEGFWAGGEGDDRGWDCWMASPTQWTWVWVNSGSWWWTGRPGVLQFMGLQRVGHDWATKLNWTTPLPPNWTDHVILFIKMNANGIFPSVSHFLSPLTEGQNLLNCTHSSKKTWVAGGL